MSTVPAPPHPTTAATGPDVDALRAACEELVQTAADPAAARALVVRVWALGAAAADHLLLDLRDVAECAAARSGTEPGAADLLEALGRHDDAAGLRDAVASGLAAHERTAREAAVAERAVLAARAAARIAAVVHHRGASTRAA